MCPSLGYVNLCLFFLEPSPNNRHDATTQGCICVSLVLVIGGEGGTLLKRNYVELPESWDDAQSARICLFFPPNRW